MKLLWQKFSSFRGNDGWARCFEARSGTYYLHAHPDGSWCVGAFLAPSARRTCPGAWASRVRGSAAPDLVEAMGAAEGWLLSRLESWASTGVCPEGLTGLSVEPRVEAEPDGGYRGDFSVDGVKVDLVSWRAQFADAPLDAADADEWPHAIARPRGGPIAALLANGRQFEFERLGDLVYWCVATQRSDRYRFGTTDLAGFERRSVVGSLGSVNAQRHTTKGTIFGRLFDRLQEREGLT